MANIQHATITDPNIHEPKGATTAAVGDAYVSDGLGSGSWKKAPVPGVSAASEGQTYVADGLGDAAWSDPVPAACTTVQGIYNYSDTTTAATPIPLTVPDTFYQMTNDGLGLESINIHPGLSLEEVWDTATSTFVWTNGDVLAVGDTVDIRFSVEVTTAATDSAVKMVIEGTDTSGALVQIPLIPEQNFKSTGTYVLIRWLGVFMGSVDTLNNTAKVLVACDKTGCTVKVKTWYIRVLHTCS